jgi:hypothetical protein
MDSMSLGDSILWLGRLAKNARHYFLMMEV